MHEVARSVLGSAVAIAAVACGIALLNLFVDKTPAPAGTGPVVHSPSATPGRPTPTTALTPTTTPTVAPPAIPSVAPVQPLGPRLPLVVLNNSRRTGLAKRAAAQFQRAGWQVRGTDNFRGDTLPETTVFYSPGQEASARRLLGEFPGVRRMEPRRPGMAADVLTVVVTRDYPA